jgi:hypothetical protein
MTCWNLAKRKQRILFGGLFFRPSILTLIFVNEIKANTKEGDPIEDDGKIWVPDMKDL